MTAFPDLNPKDRGTVFFIVNDQTDAYWLEEQRVRDHIVRAKRMLGMLSSERTTYTDQPIMTYNERIEGSREMTWQDGENGVIKAEINHHQSSMSFKVYDVSPDRTTIAYKIDDIEMDDAATAKRACTLQDEASFRTVAITSMGLIIESLNAMTQEKDRRIPEFLDTVLGATYSAMASCTRPDMRSTCTTANTPWNKAVISSWPNDVDANKNEHPERRRAEDTIRKLPCCVEVEVWSDGVTLTAADVYACADPTQSSPLDRMRALAAYEKAAGSEPDA